MSKYKAGDKVVMQIMQDDYYGDYKVGNEMCSWYNSQEFFDKVTEPLSEYTEPLEVEASRLIKENAKLKAEIESAKATGQQEAWELARKIALSQSQGGMNDEDYKEIFGTVFSEHVMKNYTYTEAAAKIAEWERQKNEICVGDILLSKTIPTKCIVISFEKLENTACILWKDGSSGKRNINELKKDFKKIGHIDIASMLEQIGD